MKNFSFFSQIKVYVSLLLVGLLLIILGKIGLVNFFTSNLQSLSLPVQIGFHNITSEFGNIVTTVTQIGSLRGKNSALELDNAVLKADNARLQQLQNENKSLRDQLGTPNKDLKILQTARTIGISPFGTKSVLLIDKGGNDGVKRGFLVIYKNILIGQIRDVSPKVSSVQLLSDPATKIPVVTSNGAEGILEGEFGSGTVITNVVQDDKLSRGDLIFTSGKNNFPKGLVLGEVARVNKIDKEYFQKATANQLIKIKDLNVVFIIAN